MFHFQVELIHRLCSTFTRTHARTHSHTNASGYKLKRKISAIGHSIIISRSDIWPRVKTAIYRWLPHPPSPQCHSRSLVCWILYRRNIIIYNAQAHAMTQSYVAAWFGAVSISNNMFSRCSNKCVPCMWCIHCRVSCSRSHMHTHMSTWYNTIWCWKCLSCRTYI